MSDTDRSRYLDGYLCRWRRLLGYHAFGTGITRNQWYPPLATGIYIHKALESLLLHLKDTNELPTQEVTQSLIDPSLLEYRDTASRVGFVLSKAEEGEGYTASEMIEDQLAMAEALSHGYARIVLPFIRANYTIVGVETEGNILLPDASQPTVRYMVRPDFITRDAEGKLAIHDFKSSAWWNDDQVDSWSDSIQMMVNAAVIGNALGERIDHYYIHILVKGSRKYPTCLTHPFYLKGDPPLTQDAWAPFGRVKGADGRSRSVGKGFTKVPVRSYRPVRDWIWEMPEDACAKQFVVAGPYDVHHGKVAQFFRGLPTEEEWWRSNLADLDWSQWTTKEFQHTLDTRFPRTFSCYTYGNRCPFYELCFHHTGWADPLANNYHPRDPHHPQEGGDWE